ncbi:50S ribosomal protein L4 [Candidatus Roizmanbacteria bacterium RIFCSPHIGHO2_01_FULL_39_12b]|uniref:Large ribosomal subunit protein uL4 n=1 Tax=Candidatus Roizmanbacteria bacterium RIFCSPHIGHO2_01_FULL_39_12b TaxID=1802030 RepID=A0A1F7GC68_9BACT|nr:MAG: 50S ribosomal protein L4 [Candidatus Roizmanbacteria bacterium RIFCSPHIGHO2_01_FULL_39_12b]
METKIKTTTINRPARKLSKDSKTKQVKPTSKEKLKQLTIVDLSGKETGQMSLPDEIFNVNASDKLLSLYVRVYLNNQKFNAASTKTRGEVKGSTRKIYRQKGTGRARHGANTAPIFVGGGIAHGPRGVIKKLRINKKQRVKALFFALTSAYKNNQIKNVVDSQKIDGTTKQLQSVLESLSIDDKALIIYSGVKESLVGQAARNLESLSLTQAETLNAYDVISSRTILFTHSGLEQFIKIHKNNYEN